MSCALLFVRSVCSLENMKPHIFEWGVMLGFVGWAGGGAAGRGRPTDRVVRRLRGACRPEAASHVTRSDLGSAGAVGRQSACWAGCVQLAFWADCDRIPPPPHRE